MDSVRLADVCSKIGSGATPRGGTEVYQQRGVALIRSQNVHNGGFRYDGLVFLDDEHAHDLDGVAVRPGDVLLNITGDSVARACEAPSRVGDARVNQHVAIIRPDPGRLNARFLRYFLVSPVMQAHMLSLASAGATRNALTKGMIEDFRVPSPPLGTQRAIAHILGTLDDKIELNRRMNETLEALARAIFKSWFVDFDPVRAKMAGRQPVGMDAEIAALFPDRMQASESGEIPAGWQAGTLDSFFTVGLGGAWGEDERSDRASECVRCLRGIDCHELAEGKLPEVPVRWVSPGQAGDRRLQEGTILVEGSGSFCGRSFCWHPSFAPLIGDPVVYSNFCKRLDPKCSPAQAAICWLQMRRAYDSGELQAFRTGTAFPNLDVHGLLANLSVVLPSVPIAQAFNNLFLLTRRTDLLAQSRTLAALRDTLLPKLLSGELRIPEAEKLVESAT